MPLRYLITGATGFIGGHLVRACANYGYQVVTIARATSDTAALRDAGVIIHQGDLRDAAVVSRALDEADVVVHCAARVGVSGTSEDYRNTNVAGLQTLLDGCKGHALERFVHTSCSTVYGSRHFYGAGEDEALPKRQRDACAQSKVEAEQLAVKYYREYGVPVVVLRPGLVYGPRERHFLPWLIDRLQHGALRHVGKGQAALDCLFVRNLVDAVFLAVDNPQAVGNVYNLNDGEYISKRHFVEAVATGMGVPLPGGSQSLWWAGWRTWFSELAARGETPHYTSAHLRLLGMNLDFNIERARQQLGYRPRVSFADGMAETVAWYRSQLDPRRIVEARVEGE